jgi:hypothetical protein
MGGDHCLLPEIARERHDTPAWHEHETELRALAKPPPKRSPPTAATPEQKRKRRQGVKEFRQRNSLTMAALASLAHCDESAIRGMINGDTTRYSEDTLKRVLGIIGVKPEDW